MKKALLVASAFAVAAAVTAVVAISVKRGEPEPIVVVPGGDAERGRELIESYGCGACHSIPGIESTSSYVGPPLDDFARRRYIAGNVPNTPSNLLRWIQDAPGVEPGTVMPNLGVTEEEARDIAAYLYGL